MRSPKTAFLILLWCIAVPACTGIFVQALHPAGLHAVACSPDPEKAGSRLSAEVHSPEADPIQPVDRIHLTAIPGVDTKDHPPFPLASPTECSVWQPPKRS